MTHEERKLAARIAAHDRWARVPDRAAATAPARAALMAKFERQVDPDGSLPPDERAKRAEHARKAHFARLCLASARSRRKSREFAAESEAAEAELAALGGEPPGRPSPPTSGGKTRAEAGDQSRPETLSPDGGRAA